MNIKREIKVFPSKPAWSGYFNYMRVNRQSTLMKIVKSKFTDCKSKWPR